MTFAYQVKNEICHNKNWTGRYARAFLYGMLLGGKTFCRESISLSTEHKPVSRLYSRMLFSAVEIKTSVTTREHVGGGDRLTFVSQVDAQEDRERILAAFGQPLDGPAHLDRQQIARPEERSAFVAGLFLACSNLSDPQKDYHLEFVLSQEGLAQELLELLEELGLRAGRTERRGQPVVYCKDSKSIEDLLTMMGAPKAAMEVMNVKIYKDVRNKVNRVTNCETSNIEKTVSAATIQTAAIRYLKEVGWYEGLEPALKETAQARLDNPDLSLRELSELMGVSRSGVNHRLTKLVTLAKKAREEKK